jgi:hypothetical protein
VLRSLILAILFSLTANVWADSTPAGADAHATAVAAYDKSDFAQTIASYETLLASGVRKGDLFYNLGNAYFRHGDKGKAIAAYLAARSLLPRDPDVKANLKFVQDQSADRLTNHLTSSTLRALFFWIDVFTPRELLFFSSGVLAVSLLLIFLSLVLVPIRAVFPWGISGCVAALVCFVLLAVSLRFEKKWGAVTVPLATVRSGPGEHNTTVFQLHEAAPFVVEDSEGEWLRILLSDDKKGWIHKSDCLTYL